MADIAAMRQEALRLFYVAIEAADPYAAVAKNRETMSFEARKKGKSYLIAFGKAAPAMARAALSQCRFDDALVVTHHENAQVIEGARVLTAGHPVPDKAGRRAAEEIIAKLQSLGPQDKVLALVSGGASALLPAPAAGVSLTDKQELNKCLLSSGLSINEMNLIRQSVSRLKGDGFLRHAAPAQVTALILSDVIGDDLRAIASGPTVASLGSKEDARQLLERTDLWDTLPGSIKSHLNRSERSETTLPEARNILVGSNRLSLEAMLRAAGSDGKIANDALVGDVQDAAQCVARAARAQKHGRAVLLFGGETTVSLQGRGKGGRNQELAVHVARALSGFDRPWVFLSGGTDGRDGPTDAAGGIVDQMSMERMRTVGCDIDAMLANNDSNALLNASGDLINTGATGTNVADVQVLIIDA